MKTKSKQNGAGSALGVAAGSHAGFLSLLSGVVEAERLVVAGLSDEMPCRKMHENRHRAFREALSMATAYFQPNTNTKRPRRFFVARPSIVADEWLEWEVGDCATRDRICTTNTEKQAREIAQALESYFANASDDQRSAERK